MWWWALACSPRVPDADLLDRLVRASVTLRGSRPGLDEMDELLRDRDLEGIARRWLDSDGFGATIRDLHAEQLLVRYDTYPHVPSVDGLAGFARADVVDRLDEEPLRWVEHVVRSGAPYTEVVTGTGTMADPITAVAYGLAYDPASPDEWQVSRYLDDRPMAGILSSTAVLQRHMSSETNHHRTRAHLVLATLLCSPLAGAAVVDPTVAEVRESPACAGCHIVLDPVASAFAGFTNYFVAADVVAGGYPLPMWAPDDTVGWSEADMPSPALGASPVGDLAALGQAVADDPRFARCTARRFLSYLTQTPIEDVPDEDIDRYVPVLVDRGWDARELALEIAIDPAFAPDRTPPRQLRPEQLARALPAVTGWSWLADVPGYGVIDHAATDEYGFRSLLGGINGWETIRPDLGASPTRELALDWAAQEAASAAVDAGVLPPSGLSRDARIERLHRLLTAEAEPDLAPDHALFDEVLARSDEDTAWKVLVTALLLDERWLTY